MLTDEQINENAQRFLSLVDSISREGMNKDLLHNQLTKSDFFVAPATTRFHGNYKGGLCEHCLNVYDNLVSLCKTFMPEVFDNSGEIITPFDENTIKIVALFHDFSKMNIYTSEVKNKKVYSETGSKSDSVGRYDWESYIGYTTKDPLDRLCIGNHESSAAFMTNTFIPLSFDEYAAIENHHAGQNFDSAPDVFHNVFHKYRLALLLYMANMMDVYNPSVVGEGSL